MTRKTIDEWLAEGPFTLTMSAGFFGFFAHAGVLLALEERGHTPAKVTGSSAGALVAGAYASGRTATELAAELYALERAHFWDPLPGPGLLRGRRFHKKLQDVLPTTRFEACQHPVAISVWDMASRRTVVRQGAGCLASAVRASCALPGLFWPVLVEGRPSLDGGISDPWGLAGTEPEERVLLHQLGDEGRGQIPLRSDLVAFVLDDLPRVDPFHLDEGRRALEDARQRTRQLLHMRAARVNHL